jgi:hypothetical protein
VYSYRDSAAFIASFKVEDVFCKQQSSASVSLVSSSDSFDPEDGRSTFLPKID